MKRVEVTLPDGRTVVMNFEDTATPEEIKAARARLIKQTQPAPVEMQPDERPDFFERRRTARVISSAGVYAVGTRPPRRRGG